MPVNIKKDLANDLSQREIYKKGGIGVKYWNYRDMKILENITGNIIVDIGCGEGITLEKVIKAFPDSTITGMDLHEENINICKNHHLPVIKGDIYKLPFENNFFDCCLFIEVIEHLEDHKKAIEEIRRILKPDGKLIIVFPNDITFFLARIMTLKFREAFYDPGHVKQWSPFSIKKFLIESNFKVVKMESLPFKLFPISLHCLVVAEKEMTE